MSQSPYRTIYNFFNFPVMTEIAYLFEIFVLFRKFRRKFGKSSLKNTENFQWRQARQFDMD